jgi:hypothetical protein
VAGIGVVVNQRGVGDGDDARGAVDRKPPARIVVEAVGDRVVRGVRVKRRQAVIPTAVPLLTPSVTSSLVASVSSQMPLTENSFTSVTVTRMS